MIHNGQTDPTDTKSMDSKRNIVIIPPLSKGLKDLKSELENIINAFANQNTKEPKKDLKFEMDPSSKNKKDESYEKYKDIKDLEIMEVMSLAEANQLIPTLGSALIIISAPKMCAMMLQNNREYLKKMNSKVLMITPQGIPDKTLEKMMKLGLSDFVQEPIVMKNLLHKTSVILRTIPITSFLDDINSNSQSTNTDEDAQHIQTSSEYIDTQEGLRLEKGILSDSELGEIKKKKINDTPLNFSNTFMNNKKHSGSLNLKIEMDHDDIKEYKENNNGYEESSKKNENSGGLDNIIETEDNKIKSNKKLADISIELPLKIKEKKSNLIIDKVDNEKKTNSNNLKLESSQDDAMKKSSEDKSINENPEAHATESRDESDEQNKSSSIHQKDIKIEIEENSLNPSEEQESKEDSSFKRPHLSQLELDTSEEIGESSDGGKPNLIEDTETRNETSRQNHGDPNKQAYRKIKNVSVLSIEIEKKDDPVVSSNIIDVQEPDKTKKAQDPQDSLDYLKKSKNLAIDIDNNKNRSKNRLTIEKDHFQKKSQEEQNSVKANDKIASHSKTLDLELDDENKNNPNKKNQNENKKSKKDDITLNIESVDNEVPPNQSEENLLSKKNIHTTQIHLEHEKEKQQHHPALNIKKVKNEKMVEHLDTKFKHHGRGEIKIDFDKKTDRGTITLDYSKLKKEYKEIIEQLEGNKDFIEKIKEEQSKESSLKKADIHLPHSNGIEHLIGIIELYLDKEIKNVDILDHIGSILWKNYLAKCGFVLLKDNSKEEDLFHNYNSDENLKKIAISTEINWNKIKILNDQNWKSKTIPSWKDDTFRSDRNEFIFPYFEGKNHMGFGVAQFFRKIPSSQQGEIEALMEAARGIYLQTYSSPNDRLEHIDISDNRVSQNKKKRL